MNELSGKGLTVLGGAKGLNRRPLAPHPSLRSDGDRHRLEH